MLTYPWYSIEEADEPIQQGDLLKSCPVAIPRTPITESAEKVAIEVIEYDVIVMSQSCDLAYRKISLVLVCPFWSLQEFASRNSYFSGAEGKERLRQGNVIGITC